MNNSPAGIRKVLTSALVAIAATFGLLAGSGVAQAVDIRAVTDSYMFSKSLGEFSTIRNQRPYNGQLDWSSDACSWSPDKPVGFNFTPACHRHDFGYRNFKKQGRWNADAKARVDNKFKSDLYGICKGNWACNRIADLYYAAVRRWGT
ncbi:MULTISPECIES: phospholipase [Crossiella]|uniref:Uncharacterized protein n=1 Tax=Crossiella cryophila TaxID=43355 RepID=A0A7W7G060_9PSEU|nr:MULTISPECIES: phospholipase [Crossiella]MBB4681879.1 hypothetical protein [Crossiella cryophila]MCK2243178.1 phospholipase [Crossiella sp. S99.2]MCK2254353.1 phospholipase [Crossiella sp. S99.1]